MNCKKLIEKIPYGIITWDEWVELRSELNFSVTEIKAPIKIQGLTINKRGASIIYLNASLSEEKKRQALQHELMHLYNNDFQSEKQLEDKENPLKKPYL